MTAAARREQLLETALRIVEQEGADRLTLGYLAASAGVSKPVAYDHFSTRSGLLIALYRWIDVERIELFRASMETEPKNRADTVAELAEVYIHCAADTTGAFHAVGAALAGSEEKAAVLAELLDHVVGMFVTVLASHSAIPQAELARACIGLVGAGEAMATALLRGNLSEAEAVGTFSTLIGGMLDVHDRPGR